MKTKAGFFRSPFPIWLASAALFPLGLAGAQSNLLSGRELANGTHYVQAFRATPDGRAVVYSLGRMTAAAHAALYRVSSNRSDAPVLLSSGTPSFLSEFQISPDSRRVVYRADENTLDLFELFSVRSNGSAAPILLSQDGSAGDVHEFAITPDGSRVLYLRDLTSGDARLFSVLIDGSALPELLSDSAQRVTGFVLSPDGSRVVYHTDGGSDALYSVPTDRSFAPIVLEYPAPARGVLGYRVSADGARVVYTALQSGTRRLFSVPIDRALPPAALDGPGGSVAGNFDLTADGHSAVYLADENVAGVFELYLVPLDGLQPPLRVSGPLASGGDVERAAELTLDAAGLGFRLAPGGGRVVYLADQDTDEMLELYSAPLDGSRTSVKLNDTLVAGGDVRFAPGSKGFELSHDGARVTYVADRDADEVFELYSVPIDGSLPPVELNGSLDTFINRDVVDFSLTPDGGTVLYRANQNAVLALDLFAVPLDGSRPSRTLTAPPPVGGFHVSGYSATPRGDLALYLADDDRDGIVELYASPLGKVRR